jgi:hypothetical protein
VNISALPGFTETKHALREHIQQLTALRESAEKDGNERLKDIASARIAQTESEVIDLLSQSIDPAADSTTATGYLKNAADTMAERGKTYDAETGERSMAATVQAFNAITQRGGTEGALSESDGWLLMLVLKQVRQQQAPGFHADSALDSVAYAALLAEAQAKAGSE